MARLTAPCRLAMDDASPPLVKPTTDAERSLVDDVKQLANDSRTLLEAEFAYQKSRAAVAGAGIKGITGWAALALALVFFALMALVMGVLLGLTALIGAWAIPFSGLTCATWGGAVSGANDVVKVSVLHH